MKMERIVIFCLSFFLCFSLCAQAQDVQKLYREGTALIKNAQYSQAVEKLEAAVKADPEHIGAAANLAVAYAYTGQIDKAITQLEKVISKEDIPSRAILYFNLGNLYLEKKDDKKAQENYNNALNLLPYFSQPYTRLANIYLNKNEKEKAQSALYKASLMQAFMPDMPNIAYNEAEKIGFLITDRKKSGPSLYLYHSPAWHISLSIDYMYDKKELSNARRELNNAILVLDKGSPLETDKFAFAEVHVYMGNTYVLEKDFDKALKEYHAAYSTDSKHVGALNNLGMTYCALGDYSRALTYCQKALEVDPNYPPALQLKQYLKEMGY